MTFVTFEQFLFGVVVGMNPISRNRKHLFIGFVLHPIGGTQHTSKVVTKLMLIVGVAL